MNLLDWLISEIEVEKFFEGRRIGPYLLGAVLLAATVFVTWKLVVTFPG